MHTLPQAYFLTWSCYGTWLHGDDRYSVDRRNHAYGGPKIDPNPARASFAAAALRAEPFRLNDETRAIVQAAVEEQCQHSQWGLIASNARTTHVHCVVAAQRDPAEIMRLLKSWSTRRLRELHQAGPRQPVWTRHGSTRYLWTEDAIAAAADYVRNRQGDRLDNAEIDVLIRAASASSRSS